MKGAMFKLLEAYVEELDRVGAFTDLLEDAGLGDQPPYAGPGTYPDEHMIALIGAATRRYAVPADELLYGFGRFAFPGLARSAGSLLDGVDDARTFLLTLESVVHTEIRKVDPEARPARFQVEEVGPTELHLRYESDLGLFPLVEGLLAGVGDWFGAPLTSELLGTDGTNASFRVLFTDVTERTAV
ncbi:MAG: heme NO-binding domain-containing protein [Actinomycetota bacterium]